MNDDKHITAEIIADSLNPQGVRITSWVLEFPRFVLAEIATHRVFSKNAASSRAIPVEKLIQQIQDNPALPVWWGKNQSGMQANEEVDDTIKRPVFFGPATGFNDPSMLTDKEHAKAVWLEARDSAIEYVKRLNAIGLHKQIANRICEPWFNIRIIMTGTEYDNFFKLRAHPDAQPEFQNLAYKMKALYETNKPVQLKAGEWHVPFGTDFDDKRVSELINTDNLTLDEFLEAKSEIKRKIAIARCARVSYLNYEGKDDYAADVKLCDRLFGSVPRHLSPTEHVAQALDSTEFIGNFKGFKQYRKFFADESGTK
jgi:thymidylate synthase ThyX